MTAIDRSCTFWIAGSILAVLVVIATGCATAESTLQTTEDVIPQLENEGLVLMYSGVSNFSDFSVTGEQYQVGAGGMLHLYEYNNENRAALDASRVDPGIMSHAHVYRSGNIVAVYIGDDFGVQSAIAGVFGAELF